MSAGHVLLVCPPGFSYHSSIKSELERLGFGVTWWNDRGDAKVAGKIVLRLMPRIGVWLLRSHFLALLRKLRSEPITHILVIKGEGLSRDVVQACKKQWATARLSLYLWDSVENVPNAGRIAPLFQTVASFDPVDARQLGWMYRPLFARDESLLSPDNEVHRLYDWCFIGTLHSDRYRVIDRLRRQEPLRRSFVFCYVPSRVLLFLRLLSNPKLWWAPPGTLSTTAMAPRAVASICHASHAMLDIEHPRQRGLTMRSIETLLSARKLITTNAHIRDSDLFHDSRAQVIEREAPRASSTFFSTEFQPIPNDVRARYTLAAWLRDLIGEPRAAH
jgi:hypothetical protein